MYKVCFQYANHIFGMLHGLEIENVQDTGIVLESL